VARLPVAEYQRSWAEGDMATAWAWSGRIVAGDLLGRDPVHQYASWMKAIAPLETWERWWGGKAVFHQAPLYAYVLAGMRWVVGDGVWAIELSQLVLGLVNVGLVALLADRFFGPLAAIVAGLGAALYGPFLLHETLLLRDTLAVTTSLLLLWALVRTDERPRRWLWAGALFTLATLARETTLLFAPGVVLWAAQRFRRRPAVCTTVVLSFVAGALLGFVPLIARNLAVGVAPWALSTRGVEAFVCGHAAGSSPFGFGIPPALRSILEASDGRPGPAIRLTLATYEGDWGRLLAHEVTKLGAIVSRYEAMDNANWYYFADRSPFLGWSLRYEVVLALGLVGLWTPGTRTRTVSAPARSRSCGPVSRPHTGVPTSAPCRSTTPSSCTRSWSWHTSSAATPRLWRSSTVSSVTTRRTRTCTGFSPRSTNRKGGPVVPAPLGFRCRTPRRYGSGCRPQSELRARSRRSAACWRVTFPSATRSKSSRRTQPT